MDLHVRWLIRRDLPEVLAIEQAGWAEPWAEEEFLRHLRQRHTIGMVCEAGPEIAGFMVYEQHKHSLVLLRLGVRLDLRGKGVGRRLVERLRSKLCHRRRPCLEMVVPDRPLGLHLFLKAVGFRAVGVLGDGRDEYRFQVGPFPTTTVEAPPERRGRMAGDPYP